MRPTTSDPPAPRTAKRICQHPVLRSTANMAENLPRPGETQSDINNATPSLSSERLPTTAAAERPSGDALSCTPAFPGLPGISGNSPETLAAPRQPAPVLRDVPPNSVGRADAALQIERGPVFQRELVPSVRAGAAVPPIFQGAAVPGVQGMGMLLSRQLNSAAYAAIASGMQQHQQQQEQLQQQLHQQHQREQQQQHQQQQQQQPWRTTTHQPLPPPIQGSTSALSRLGPGRCSASALLRRNNTRSCNTRGKS